ncbi:MAG: cobalamin-binding protein [Pseudohongiella sp.]|nr:MAG: cobalamin-binding protein [Pseudohongiella sp.]
MPPSRLDIRLVSLLPSATEIVCALGLQEYLVGVSHECDYPAAVAGLPVVTNTAIPKGLTSDAIDKKVRDLLQTDAALYHLNVDALLELRPTHIVTQALCDVCAVSAVEIEEVACQLPGNPQIVNLEPMTLQQVLDTFTLIGAATQHESAAASVVQGLRNRVDAIAERSAALAESEKPRVAMLEWIDPLFNAGHWTPELVAMAGGIDCLGCLNKPSIGLNQNALAQAQPDVLFVALCGFDLARTEQDLPLLERLPGWKDLPCVREGRVYYTDGNAYFSRAGPRLVESLEILAQALHPDVHPVSSSGESAQRWPLHA